MKKRIMMISSTWDISFVITLLHGMERRLMTTDADLYIFNAFDEMLINRNAELERMIYMLPDQEHFDGVLLAANSVGNQSSILGLTHHYQSLGLPVLSLDSQIENVPFIGTDNYEAMYEMTEHMILEHGCKTFNYVGGPKDHIENQERFRGFCDCLANYGLKADPERVLHLSFLASDGNAAYHTFKAKGLHLPDAVVVANDNMALGYCTEVFEDGYSVPEDVKVTGFDNSQDAQMYSPSITSVERNWEQLGYDSVSNILDMIDGKTITAFFTRHTLHINESCGCCTNRLDLKQALRKSYLQKLNEEHKSFMERQIRSISGRCHSVEDFQERLETCKAMYGVSHIALCLNSYLLGGNSEHRNDYDNEFVVHMNSNIYHLRREDGLVPSGFSCGHHIYFFSPLYYENVNFGYCITQPTTDWNPNLDHRTLKEVICLGLEGVRQNNALNRMNNRLRELYVIDALTGMYNRFGYETLARSLYEKCRGQVYAIYFDLDNLKTVNDLYGHSMGDQVIIGLAKAINRAFREDDIKVRMGGDEFLVLGADTDDAVLLEKEQTLLTDLKNFIHELCLPESVSVSYGHLCNKDGRFTLEEMIQLTDQKMYEQKQKKKRQ